MPKETNYTQTHMEYRINEQIMSPFSTFLQQEEYSMFFHQEPLEMLAVQEGSEITYTTTDSITNNSTGEKIRRSSAKDISSDQNMLENQSAPEGSNMKRLDHNAKERIRRVRLKSSYSDLSAILPPNSAESKKGRSSSAVIVDRVLKYIPEMQSEIENLKQTRDNMQSASNKRHIIDQDPHSKLQCPTVTVSEIKKGEAIIQICTRKDHGGFSNLLQNFEAQGINIKSASTLCICDDTICYQLHIEVPHSSLLPSSAFIMTLL